MNAVIDAAWRAAADLLRPRTIAMSLAPLAVMLLLSALLAWWAWAPALAAFRGWLETWGFYGTLGAWLQGWGLGRLHTALAPLLLALLLTPVAVLLAVLLAALLMTPAMLRLVAARRFPQLARRGQAPLARSLAWSAASTTLALCALLFTLPLWLFLPPLVLVLPPLIWGWLTYRVTSFDVLAEHATPAERQALMRRERAPLLAMGVACGLLGAAPGVAWASGLVFAALFWLLVPLAVWLYALVFAFTALWFAHYCLAALQAQRGALDAGVGHDGGHAGGPGQAPFPRLP
ncbi:hypothetical protein EII20_08930 [Comamonadaceae bacterium OH2545_COT-014]|nr:hypothetical protein EII20_08930 [Comamonadaceae bacterium OH2545_COT-014]